MSTQKRVFIIHGWDGYPEEGWFPWLKTRLEQRGFTVEIPQMPNPSKPRISEWVGYLKQSIGNPDENTYLVGHSIGCQTILRYLESLNDGEKMGGAVFVVGWFLLANLETDEEREIAKPWLDTSIAGDKVRNRTHKFIAIFSDNDPFVLTDNQGIFRNVLGAKIIIESKKGHFGGSDDVKELPSALEAVLEIAGEK